MKKLICLAFVAFVVFLSLVTAFAHGGRTDGSGGHYDRSSGEYHYHHGHSAHQHPNGVCPYEEDEKTTNSNYEYAKKPFDNSYSSSKSKAKKSDDILNIELFVKCSDNYKWKAIDVVHLVSVLVVCVTLWVLMRKEGNEYIVSIILSAIIGLCFSLSIDFSNCIQTSDIIFEGSFAIFISAILFFGNYFFVLTVIDWFYYNF